LLEAIEGYVTGSLLPIPQPQEGITYAHKLTREEGVIDWSFPADALLRKIQALTPWPGVWFDHNGTRLKVLKAEVISNLAREPGMVLDDQLTIACGIGALRPTILQRPGGVPLDTDAFLRGYPLPAGTHLCPATS
jgi:methionyl-tRNA formyltransferase